MSTTPQITDQLTHLTPRQLWELAEAYFVYDPADAGDTGRLARELGRFRGVVCVEIPPGEPRPLGALALAILQRLGKDLDREKQIGQQDAWRLARVWMDAETIQALIIIGADQLALSTWKELVDVCRQMPTRACCLRRFTSGADVLSRRASTPRQWAPTMPAPRSADSRRSPTMRSRSSEPRAATCSASRTSASSTRPSASPSTALLAGSKTATT